MTEKQPVIEIYTEYTPNPESLKFVLNRMLLKGTNADYRSVGVASGSPLALELFNFPYVEGVFIANNFVTITKKPEHKWIEIIPELKQFLKTWIAEDRAIITDGNVQKPVTESPDGGGVEDRIKELLDHYVRPAVEMDGGAIQYKSFEDGTVTVLLQGSCSGCPSATLTLKTGIEGLLMKMVPEVKEVIAEEI